MRKIVSYISKKFFPFSPIADLMRPIRDPKPKIAFLFLFSSFLFIPLLFLPLSPFVLLLSLLIYEIFIIKIAIELKEEINRKLFFVKYLQNFIYQNNLYDLVTVERNMGEKIVKHKEISNSLRITYEIGNDVMKIIVLNKGNGDRKKGEEIGNELEAYFNKTLTKMIKSPSKTIYIFDLEEKHRLIMEPLPETADEITLNSPLNLGYKIMYDYARAPHVLISGSTGSGKSVLLEVLIIQLLRQNYKKKSDEKIRLFVCDPKNSDLASLKRYLGDEHVGTSEGEIAKICRLLIEEMTRRYEYMNANFRYGATYKDFNLPSIWLFFDEIGAFSSTSTKKVKEEVIDGYITKILLLGRAAGVFLVVAAQKFSTEHTLNSTLRDQFSLRIALRSSVSGMRMVFDDKLPDTDTLKPIESPGTGYLYLEGSGNEYASYYEAPYVNRENFDFIKELKKVI